VKLLSTSTRSYRLRDARATDRWLVWDIHETTVKPYLLRLDGWDESLEQRRFRRWFHPARLDIIVVDREDVGVLEVERSPGRIYLSRIEIRPGFQNRGIGSAVVRDLVAEGRRRRRAVLLHVFKINPAHRLYRRLGFRVVDEDETRLAMRVDPQTA